MSLTCVNAHRLKVAAMTLAAVDRLVRHATIFEMNVKSYWRRTVERANGPGRPVQRATSANTKTD
jgi:hypothetical protein